MVYMFLELSYMASVQRNVELFVDVFDKDGDGHITDVELLDLIKKELPDDTTLASRVAEIFETTDLNKSGGICAGEMRRALLQSDAGRATRLNLLKHAHHMCQKLPAPTQGPGENAMRQMVKIRKVMHPQSYPQAPINRLRKSGLVVSVASRSTVHGTA